MRIKVKIVSKSISPFPKNKFYHSYRIDTKYAQRISITTRIENEINVSVQFLCIDTDFEE